MKIPWFVHEFCNLARLILVQIWLRNGCLDLKMVPVGCLMRFLQRWWLHSPNAVLVTERRAAFSRCRGDVCCRCWSWPAFVSVSSAYGHNVKSSNDFIGRVVIGQYSTGSPESNHWRRMLNSHRTAVEQWHSLRSRAECDRVSPASLEVTWEWSCVPSESKQANDWEKKNQTHTHSHVISMELKVTVTAAGNKLAGLAYVPQWPFIMQTMYHLFICPLLSQGHC